MSASQVQTAIETLETSYSYESTRWMESYRALRVLEREINEQMKPYSWIARLLGWVSLAWFAGVIAWLLTHSRPIFSGNEWLNTLALVTAMLLPSWLIRLGGWLTIKVATRRHPLLPLKARIETAMDRFHALAGDPIREEYA